VPQEEAPQEGRAIRFIRFMRFIHFMDFIRFKIAVCRETMK